MPDDPQVQPTEGQGQQVPIPVSTPVGDGPWSNDLNLIFQDEATRGQVDQFLRQKVQPYTTQLEQEKAAAKDATALWNDLSANPLDTYVAITHEMFGEEAANALLASLQENMNGQEQQQQQGYEQQAPLDPRMEAALAFIEEQQANNSYESEMYRLTSENPDVDADLMHPFVAAAGGDFDEALNLYRAYTTTYTQKQFATLTPEQQAALQPAAPVAPNVMGSDSATAQPSATPLAPRKQTLDQAIGDFMAENRASRQAPPVGSI